MNRDPGLPGSYLAILIAGLLLAACSSAATVEPAPAPPTATGTPAATITPTPVPELVLFAEGDPALAERLRQWAAERGWGMRLVEPEGASGALGDPRTDPQAVVVLRAPVGVELEPPAVLVEVEGAIPLERVSTVGTPATHHGEAGFLAGLLAGLTTQVEWVGQVTRAEDPLTVQYLAGFEQGLKVGCPRCRLVSLSIAEVTVDGFRGQGVDAVFVPPGPDAFPIARALGEAGLWLVWVGELPEGLPASALAGRAAFAPEALVLPALEQLLGGAQAQAWPYTIANGGLALADVNPEAISPGRQRLLNEYYQAVVSGELDIGLER